MNKQKFMKSLSAMTGWRETAFILALAERALPNLDLYLGSTERSCLDEVLYPDGFESVMSQSWHYAIMKPAEEPAIELLDTLNDVLDLLAEDENYGALPSRDCCQLWEQALVSSLNQEKKRSAECSQASLTTIIDFIEFSEGENLSDNALVKLFDSHPLVEREFSFQAELCEMLRSAKHPSKELMEQVRELANDEGISSIGISLS